MSEKENMLNGIEAKITSGAYIGEPVKIQFAKPLKIFVSGKDVSDKVVELNINISRRGWLVNILFAETSMNLIGGTR